MENVAKKTYSWVYSKKLVQDQYKMIQCRAKREEIIGNIYKLGRRKKRSLLKVNSTRKFLTVAI